MSNHTFLDKYAKRIIQLQSKPNRTSAEEYQLRFMRSALGEVANPNSLQMAALYEIPDGKIVPQTISNLADAA